MDFKVIVLCGYARSGKDSLFKGFHQNDPNCERIAFADSLKSEIDGFLKNHLQISAWTEDTDEKSIIRPMLVAYGEAMRKIELNHWLNKGLEKIDESSNKTYVFTDARYINELKGIEEKYPNNSKFIRVKRQGNKPVNAEENSSFAVIDAEFSFDKEILMPSIETSFGANVSKEEIDKKIQEEFKTVAQKIVQEIY